MLKKIAIALFVVSLSSAGNCPEYKCHEQGIDYGNTCMHPSEGNFLLQICQSKSAPHCQVDSDFSQNFTCVAEPRPQKEVAYPGEFCKHDSDCVSGACIFSRCSASSLGEKCSYQRDCNVGLYCSNDKVCKAQKTEGMDCGSDYECQNNLGCDRTFFTEGKCVKYFSVQNFDNVGLCLSTSGGGISNLCQEGSCDVVDIAKGTGSCISAWENVNFGLSCDTDDECMGDNGYSVYIGACSCGMSQYGNKYCNSFTGDYSARKARRILQKHFNTTAIHNCHTDRRVDRYCLMQTLEPYEAFQYEIHRMYSNDLPRYQNNDECTKTIFNSDYWYLSGEDYSCQAYSCENSTDWLDGVCISYGEKNSTFGIKECPSGQYCNYEMAVPDKYLNVSCGGQKPPVLAYPGEKCDSNTQCMHSQCINQVCLGTQEGQPCSQSEECNPGLYCGEKIVNDNVQFQCLPLKKKGEKCNSDFECQTNSTCDVTSWDQKNTSQHGVCVEYFSVRNGKPVSCPVSGTNFLCESGTCYTIPNSGIGFCTAAPSYETYPKQCTTSNRCIAKNWLNETFIGQCQCGYNADAKSYCSPFLGEEVGQTYLHLLKTYLSRSEMAVCQTTRRYSTACAQMVAEKLGGDPLDFYTKILNFTNSAKYIGNDKCVKDTFTSDFWNHHPKPEVPRNFSVSGLGAGANMALQLHIAFSEHIEGSGLIAGSPYYCAQNSYSKVQGCETKPSSINLPALYNATSQYASQGLIDNPQYLTSTKAWVFSGKYDFNVYQDTVKKLEDYLKHYLGSSNVVSVYNVSAGNGFITDDWGQPCAITGYPWINNCGIDTAGEILQLVYGKLNKKRPERSDNLYTFDQRFYVPVDVWEKASMEQYGYIYIPKTCLVQECRIHVVLHSCDQDYDETLGVVVYHTGYNQWAESNNLIIIYPQAKATVDENLQACWDWWGYTNSNYATKQGIQMKAIIGMTRRLPVKLSQTFF